MYIIPGGVAPANLYKEGFDTLQVDLLDHIIGPSVYFGSSSFPKGLFLSFLPGWFRPWLTCLDVGYIPIWWARCKIAKNIVFWAEHEKGGHFAAVENPEVLVGDIRGFVEKIQGATWAGLVKAGAGDI